MCPSLYFLYLLFSPFRPSIRTGTRVPDGHGRLDSITWRTGGATGSVLLSNDYTLDSRGRRTASAREDGLGWSYGYNDRGEVTSGSRGAQSFVYTYDEIGNRITATTTAVEQDGAQTIAYTANALNQYMAITNPDPGKRTVRGQLHAQAVLSASSSAPPPPATYALQGTSGTNRIHGAQPFRLRGHRRDACAP